MPSAQKSTIASADTRQNDQDGTQGRSRSGQGLKGPTAVTGPQSILADDMVRFCKFNRISQNEVGNWIGYSSAVISQWTRGVYRGNTVEIAKMIGEWLALRKRASSQTTSQRV